MRNDKNIEQKVNHAYQQLQNPNRFEGSSQFENRVMAAFDQKPSKIFSLNLPRIAGWAAAVMVVINISMLATRQFNFGTSDDNNAELFLENYDLMPASSWDNYFAVDDINSIDYENEER